MDYVASSTTLQKPKLLVQVKAVIGAKQYSIRTEQAYVNWIKKYVLYPNKRHPKELGASEINQFLSHLANNANVAASTQNQAWCALLFLYKEVLASEIGDIGDVIRAKKPKRLPIVFTPKEVRFVLNQLSGVSWLMVNCFGS